MFYSVPATVPLAQLLGDALILASSTGHDVFNALDIFENGPVLRGACEESGLLLRALAGGRMSREEGTWCHPLDPSLLQLDADLKFGIGDGKLRYYLYNWRVAKGMQPSDVGLVML